MNLRVWCITGWCILGIVCAPSRAPAKPLSVYILMDGEGVATFTGHKTEARNEVRKNTTDEVNAAIEGALAAGATRITVQDAHSTNLITQEVNPKARQVSAAGGAAAVGSFCPGINTGYDALILLGMHASSKTIRAQFAHTMSDAKLREIRLNDKHVSESYLFAAVAGHYGVPVVLVAGDDKAIEEVQRTVDKNITGVVLKKSLGWMGTDSVAPSVAQAMIRDATKAALGKLGSVRAFRLPAGPHKLELELTNYLNTEGLALLPIAEQIDGLSVRFRCKDAPECWRLIWFAARYKFHPSPDPED